MTAFSIEDDKDAIKMKPSYPGCWCKQQASPYSPAPSGVMILRKLRGHRLPQKNSALLPSWKDGNEAMMGRLPGGEEPLEFCIAPQSQGSVPLKRSSPFPSSLDTLVRDDCWCDACPGDLL